MKTLLALLFIGALLILTLVVVMRLAPRSSQDPSPEDDPADQAASAHSSSTGQSGPPPAKSTKYLSAEEASYYLIPDASGHLPVRIRDGLFFHRETRRMVPPGNMTLAKHGVTSFSVRGVAHYEAAAKAADTSPGTEVIFTREPDNRYDDNAIAIAGLDDQGKERIVGYVNKGNARRLAKRMDAGEPIQGWFMRGSGHRIEPTGIAVVITDEDRKRQLF